MNLWIKICSHVIGVNYTAVVFHRVRITRRILFFPSRRVASQLETCEARILAARKTGHRSQGGGQSLFRAEKWQTEGMEKTNVESFQLDHRLVAAPFVRVAHRETLPGGDELIKYDVRFTQPNQEHLEMTTIHSLEHSVAELMRNHTDRLIDFSPMGCQTGFYALTRGLEPEEFMQVLELTLGDVTRQTRVPAANEVQCGWGANHSLEGAQAAAQRMLNHRDEWEQVFR